MADNYDEMKTRLMTKLAKEFGTTGNRSPVCFFVRQAIARHPELKGWTFHEKETLADEAINDYFAPRYCGCGGPATHRHHGVACCGGSTCCSKRNA